MICLFWSYLIRQAAGHMRVCISAPRIEIYLRMESGMDNSDSQIMIIHLFDLTEPKIKLIVEW